MSKESAGETLSEDSSAEDPAQTVIPEDTEQVITELTPIEDKAQVQANTKPIAPPPDEEEQRRLPKCDMLPNVQTSVPESTPEESPQKSSEDVSRGRDGQVYNPVFDWIAPPIPQGRIIDNDEDINKQVGTMNWYPERAWLKYQILSCCSKTCRHTNIQTKGAL